MSSILKRYCLLFGAFCEALGIRKIMKSVKNINDAATVLPNMYKINENVKLLALDYKPIRDEVRFIELKINKSKKKIKSLKSLLQTLDKSSQKKEYENLINEIEFLFAEDQGRYI